MLPEDWPANYNQAQMSLHKQMVTNTFKYRDPFVILGLINSTPHLQVQLLLKHCPVPQSHQPFISFVFFVSSF